MPSLVTLTGLDGSGKSTCADELVRYFARRGARCTYVHQFSFLTPGVRHVMDWMTQRPWRAIQAFIADAGTDFDRGAPGREHRGRMTTQAARLIVGFGLVGLGFVRTWWRMLRLRSYDVIVFDRYFYDDLVRAEWKFGVPFSRWRTLSTLVPRPDLVIYLTPSPYVSWRRKKRRDATLGAFLRKDMLYRGWMQHLRSCALNLHSLPTDDRPVEAMTAEAVRLASQLLPDGPSHTDHDAV